MPELINSDLDALLTVLPPTIREPILALPDRGDLLEIVLDLGRLPEARFPTREVFLSDAPVNRDDLDYVVGRIGQFGADNRAGIERTLHRISALRNRRGEVVGLTCRVGRAVRGTVTLLRDVIEQGRSILILGRPGVGKTTLLREAARVLADELGKRVVVVDTSNEIAGDGDIPHPGIGRARRMQVAHPQQQHAVMIEAVENHMPEVIVIDEIGTELEAQAARTIAERGVQLVGTAHGRTLENLLLNPTLADLVGGIQAVTLGDEEARRRGTQKTVLERKAPPTFDVLVEQLSWREVIVHKDVAEAVDNLLRGQQLTAERRTRDEHDQLRREQVVIQPGETSSWGAAHANEDSLGQWEQMFDGRRKRGGRNAGRQGRDKDVKDARRIAETRWRAEPQPPLPTWEALEESSDEDLFDLEPTGTSGIEGAGVSDSLALVGVSQGMRRRPVRIYPFGVSRERLEQSARELRAPVEISHDQENADAVITLRTFYRRHSDQLRGVGRKPVYILRTNTVTQMQQCLARIFDLRQREEEADDGIAEDPTHPTMQAMQETEDAIMRLLNRGEGQIALPPANSYVRRLQHRIAERYNLASRSHGKEPNRYVRVYAR
ncbi:MAG TPA: R3H domain-containing nucleic acid-binding protein [Ktedonobacterales bacterium]|nr:R3H domain-containing nucleic acid-binding protein [Ktedonobacterales bacterium]